jgi:ribosome maturation protein Sdo1
MLTILRQGTQGALDTASNAELDNEFGTHNVDEAISTILDKGSHADVTVSCSCQPLNSQALKQAI